MRATTLLLLLGLTSLVSCKHYLNDYEIDRGDANMSWPPTEETEDNRATSPEDNAARRQRG